MTGAEFITFIKAKLNRLDSSANEDVRPEEVLLFANDALKNLVLNFDIGNYSPALDKNVILNYLSTLTVLSPEITLANNSVAIPLYLKIKDMQVLVSIAATTSTPTESGWVTTRALDNNKSSSRENNSFMKSYPDMPTYRITDSKILFMTDGFTCSKLKYEYIKYPPEITEAGSISFIYMKELQDATVTSILETLESRRVQSQAVVSKT